MVVRQILDLNVEVRALVGQHRFIFSACISIDYRRFFIEGLTEV
jgi:hypothetical protein